MTPLCAMSPGTKRTGTNTRMMKTGRPPTSRRDRERIIMLTRRKLMFAFVLQDVLTKLRGEYARGGGAAL